MKKVALKIEDLEERIAPSFTFTDGSDPDAAGADPTGGQGDLDTTFGPNSGELDNKNGWTAHGDRSTNEGEAYTVTPIDNGGNA